VAAARAAGDVGEQADGYLGFVGAPSGAVKAAVDAPSVLFQTLGHIKAAKGKEKPSNPHLGFTREPQYARESQYQPQRHQRHNEPSAHKRPDAMAFAHALQMPKPFISQNM
jgi:hypothetical protein